MIKSKYIKQIAYPILIIVNLLLDKFRFLFIFEEETNWKH